MLKVSKKIYWELQGRGLQQFNEATANWEIGGLWFRRKSHKRGCVNLSPKPKG